MADTVLTRLGSKMKHVLNGLMQTHHTIEAGTWFSVFTGDPQFSEGFTLQSHHNREGTPFEMTGDDDQVCMGRNMESI